MIINSIIKKLKEVHLRMADRQPKLDSINENILKKFAYNDEFAPLKDNDTPDYDVWRMSTIMYDRGNDEYFVIPF